MFQLISKTLWMTRCLLLCKVYIPCPSEACVKLLILVTQTRGRLWNNFGIVMCLGFHSWRTNIGCAATTCAVGAIAVVTRDTFADDLAVYVSAFVISISFKNLVKLIRLSARVR
jgi:hypothetical protein